MNPRTLAIVSSVVMFHIAALWAMHTGLLQRVVEVVVPVMAISQAEPPPPPPKPPEPVKPPEPPKLTPPPKTPQPVLTPPPTPQPPAPATPEPPAVLAAPTAAPTAPAVQAAPPAPPPPAPPAPPPTPAAPAKVEMPSSKADYLQNPPLEYPRLSQRLGEQGKVILNVLIGPDGVAQKVELHTSSGFERLDKAALAAVIKWRFVPGKRNGVPEAMWYLVPITFTQKKE
jgi:protein TonB